jgi:hypothetical protein
MTLFRTSRMGSFSPGISADIARSYLAVPAKPTYGRTAGSRGSGTNQEFGNLLFCSSLKVKKKRNASFLSPPLCSLNPFHLLFVLFVVSSFSIPEASSSCVVVYPTARSPVPQASLPGRRRRSNRVRRSIRPAFRSVRSIGPQNLAPWMVRSGTVRGACRYRRGSPLGY